MNRKNQNIRALFVLGVMSSGILLGINKAYSSGNMPDENKDLPYPTTGNSPYDHELPKEEKGIQLKKPSNIKSSVVYDPATNTYILSEKVGEDEYTPTKAVTLDEYKTLRFKEAEQKFWKEKSKNDADNQSSGGLARSFNIQSKAFKTIFGSNTVNIVPQGSAELIFSIKNQKIDNPALQERLRSTTTFDFQENIQLNVTGNIGDRVTLGINYDTKATFDFENKTNIGYTGDEDQIIQKIEAGNVSLPLTGSLITGSQNLFGFKTELKFGKLYMTNVFSQQKGQKKVIEVEGGAEKRYFEVGIDNYDDRRHFFLSQYFKEHYDSSFQSLPMINSSVKIERVEVWVTNKNNNYENSRNIVAFMDLAENPNFGKNNLLNDDWVAYKPIGGYSFNDANDLYATVTTTDPTQLRSKELVSTYLENGLFGGKMLKIGEDYEKIENARLLNPNEYTLNPILGFVSLNMALDPNQILAVAYEYRVSGVDSIFKVGELTSDIREAQQNLVVKLIKGTNHTPRYPTWGLMMKNVYSLGAYNISAEDFDLQIMYKDDEIGTAVPYLSEGAIKDKLLLQVLNLDNLNSQLDYGQDGMFDFWEGITILAQNGRVIFPVREPFGRYLESQISNQEIADKYTYKELYDSTLTMAKQVAEKNKFIITGSYKSDGGADIPLNAMNVPRGSVTVSAGGVQLVENQDFTVDYTLGRVKILNEGLLQSGTPIQISLENNALYNMQTKTLIGTHLDYKFSDNFILSGTLLNLTERPLTRKVNVGDEPISNTIWGINGAYSTKSLFLTKMVDKIPFIDTKESSSINLQAEFAQLIPGHSRAINKEGVAYIDDFEGSQSGIDVKSFNQWVISSTPKNFPESDSLNNVIYGFNRAKLAWYVIDPLFLRTESNTPEHIKDNPEFQSSHYVREVFEKELFPQRENVQGVPTNIPVLNLAYYPHEKGPYNYNARPTDINSDGRFINPQGKWGGIMRPLPTTDFEAANIEFVDFWLMDPFEQDQYNTNKTGGKLYINLGDISEDILKDSRKMFENGLPIFTNDSAVSKSSWGRIPKAQSFVNAFENNPEARLYQDVGLDGYNDFYERVFFENYLADLSKLGLNQSALTKAQVDPSNDNFAYFRSSEYDAQQASILARYKNFNGQDGNSPASEQTNESYNQSGSTLPDNEDINKDGTLNESDRYFEYELDITPQGLKVGKNYIMDATTYTAEFANGKTDDVTWYHFRIPIREGKSVNGTPDMNSMRFMRMYLSNFTDSVFLRFATLELIRGEWRKYNFPVVEPGEAISVPQPSENSFDISAVNIEQNDRKTPVNYILPPGIDRVVDPASPQIRQLNEQSMVLKVENLDNGGARAAYKNIFMDMREYKQLQMFVHAEAIPGDALADDDLRLFVRLGTDYTNNYYEYEIPLKVTPPGSYTNEYEPHQRIVWPDENNLMIDLEMLPEIKLERNKLVNDPTSNIKASNIYSAIKNGHRISVKGNPSLAEVVTIMIGVRNPFKQLSGQSKSGEIWINELRLTHFKEQGGWAANARASTQLADFANISVAGSTLKPGFGSLEKKTNERSKQEEWQYDIASNFYLGKFFPEKVGVRLPLFMGYSQTLINEQYDPLNKDTYLKESLTQFNTEKEKDEYLDIVQDVTTRKSINFTSVGIAPVSKNPSIIDPGNISLDYGYRETSRHNIQIEDEKEKEFNGGINYNFTTQPKNVQPLSGIIKSPKLRLISDFNYFYYPSMVGFRTYTNRRYHERKVRNVSTGFSMPYSVDKDFTWDREYVLKYDLTRSIKLDYTANNKARIDEPLGRVNRNNDPDRYEYIMDSIKQGFLAGGRNVQFFQRIGASYAIPINKIGLFNWTSANLNYSSSYSWDAGKLLKDPNQTSGNTINNSNSWELQGNFTMRNLYNKVPFLKNTQRKYSSGKRSQEKVKKQTVEKKGVDFQNDKPKTIHHNIGTESVKLWVTNAKGEEITGELKIINKNKVTFTPKSSAKNCTVKFEGEAPEKVTPLVYVGEQTSLLMMSVKTISISYRETEGLYVPGYLGKTKFFGGESNASRTGGVWAPGAPIVLGWQDPNFIENAYNYHWLLDRDDENHLNIADQMRENHKNDLNLRANVEPVNGLRIDLTGTRSYDENTILYYPIPMDYNATVEEILESPTTMSGSLNMTFVSIGSAWEKSNSENFYESKVFNTFLENRKVISDRLYNQSRYKEIYESNPVQFDYLSNRDSLGYNQTSPNVLIPAFFAAYSGKDPNKTSLDAIPDWRSILPNWQIRYTRLTDFDFFKKYFRTLSLSHGYSSTYSVNSIMTNTKYYDMDKYGTPRAGDVTEQTLNPFDFAMVSINEQFRPLFGVEATLINNITARFQIRKSRSINLSFASNRLTEVKTDEIVIGAGYRFENIRIMIGKNPPQSDLNLSADYTIRDNTTILRDLNQLPQISQGKKMTSLKFSADYALSSKFTTRAFFTRDSNIPFVSSSFPTRNWTFGFSLRFTLTT